MSIRRILQGIPPTVPSEAPANDYTGKAPVSLQDLERALHVAGNAVVEAEAELARRQQAFEAAEDAIVQRVRAMGLRQHRIERVKG